MSVELTRLGHDYAGGSRKPLSWRNHSASLGLVRHGDKHPGAHLSESKKPSELLTGRGATSTLHGICRSAFISRHFRRNTSLAIQSGVCRVREYFERRNLGLRPEANLTKAGEDAARGCGSYLLEKLRGEHENESVRDVDACLCTALAHLQKQTVLETKEPTGKPVQAGKDERAGGRTKSFCPHKLSCDRTFCWIRESRGNVARNNSSLRVPRA